MKKTLSPQENWHDLCQLLQNYLLTTSVPLIFGPLLMNPHVLKNESYQQLRQEFERKDQLRAVRHQLREVWNDLLRQNLTEVFKLRLLGSQTDLDKYRKRSVKYLRVLNDMFGTHDSYNDLSVITESFFHLLKDYLCRNMPYLPTAYQGEEVLHVMRKCREIYSDRRYRDRPSEYVHLQPDDEARPFYIPFEEQSYTGKLLKQTDEIAADMKKHPKAQHYLVLSEHIQTLFIYVYMVEFVKNYPGMKGKPFEDNDALRHDRRYNLFTFLSYVDYIVVYEDLFGEVI